MCKILVKVRAGLCHSLEVGFLEQKAPLGLFAAISDLFLGVVPLGQSAAWKADLIWRPFQRFSTLVSSK